MNPYAALPATAWLLNIIVWSFVYGQRRKNPINYAFLLFTGWASTWLLIKFALYLPFSVENEMAIFKVAALFWVPLGFLFLNFSYRLVGRKTDTLWWILLAATAAAALLYIATDLGLTGFTRREWGVVTINGPAQSWIAIFTAGCATYGLTMIHRASRKTNDRALRSTYRLLVIGGGSNLAVIMTLNVIIPNALGLEDSFRFGASTLAIFCIFVFFAVSRYNFLSISVESVAEELFDDLGDGIILIDESGNIRRINKACQELLDIDAAAWHGRPLNKLLPGRDFESDFQDEETHFGEGDAQQKLSMSLSSIVRSGVVLGRLVLLRDITEQKKTEEVLRRSRDDLAEQATHRTEELRRAQKMEALGTLAGGIAHDFNNLLAAILGFTSAARGDLPESSVVREDLDEVLHAAGRAKDIVRQILAFSRQNRFEPVETDISSTVEEALTLLEASLPATIDIHKELSRNVGYVFGDATQISQVIMNIGTNAFQAMQDTGGDLTVRLDSIQLENTFLESTPSLSPGRYAIIEVTDTGDGMTAETLDRIYDPFFTTKPLGQGTGLGLATVLSILDNHNGAITVESEVGYGTTFRVYFPALAESDLDEETSKQEMLEGNEKIIVVDDEDQFVRMVRRILEPLGYELSTYTSALEAWRNFRDQPGRYDLLITDYLMPNMNGRELAAEILGLRPELPVILVSGNANVSDMEQKGASDFTTFLAKPISNDELCSTVRQLLDSHQ